MMPEMIGKRGCVTPAQTICRTQEKKDLQLERGWNCGQMTKRKSSNAQVSNSTARSGSLWFVFRCNEFREFGYIEFGKIR